MAGEVTLPLKHPFEFDGETVTELTFRRPKGRDIKKFARIKDTMQLMEAQVVDLAQIKPGAFEEMDGEDLQEAGIIIAGFSGLSEEEARKQLSQSISS
jgi:hypothetical protein